jgi:hypothetical protein
MEGANAAETLAGECALKAIETADNLCKEVDAERESSAALKVQVELLTKRLEDAKELGFVSLSFMWVPWSNLGVPHPLCLLSLRHSTSSCG